MCVGVALSACGVQSYIRSASDYCVHEPVSILIPCSHAYTVHTHTHTHTHAHTHTHLKLSWRYVLNKGVWLRCMTRGGGAICRAVMTSPKAGVHRQKVF